MTVLLMDSFNNHGSVSSILGNLYKWEINSGNSVTGTTAPRANWRSMYNNVSSRCISHTIRSGVIDPIYIGFAYAPNFGSTHGGFLFRNDDGIQSSVYWQSDGKLRAYRYHNGGTLLGTSTNRVLENQQWVYIEIKIITHDTTGAIQVKINGNVVAGLDLTNQDTLYAGSTNGINQVDLYGLGWITDWYIDDAQFHGPVRIDCLYPDGAGNYSQLSPSAGSNYQNVDEPNDPDYNTTYNDGDALNEKDTYAIESIPTLSGSTIKAVAVSNVARKTDLPVTKIKNMVRVNSSDYYESSEQELQTSFRHFQAIWELNPDDSAAWEEADINAMEAGLEITTLS